MNTTQAAISRLEDPSYGRLSLKTLVDLAQTFDTGLQVRFVSLVRQMRDTWVVARSELEVASFEEEAKCVSFVTIVASDVDESLTRTGSHTPQLTTIDTNDWGVRSPRRQSSITMTAPTLKTRELVYISSEN
jgi:hypothetical protein